MRGRLASRAHSFKENILGAFGHHSTSSEPQSPASLVNAGEEHGNYEGRSFTVPSFAASKKGQNNSQDIKKKNSGHERSSGHVRKLSQKRNSSDNLIEYSATKCTDTLVREVELALRYFEDAVAKGTYEMLPGCATVVLETVVAMQSYAVSKASQALQAVMAKENEAANNGMTLKPPLAFEDPVQQRSNQDRFGIFKAMENVYSCVAKLTQWADRLIVEGHIDKEDDYIEKIIEPLRKSVLVLANAIASSDEPNRRSTAGMRRSLPDVLAIEGYELADKDKHHKPMQPKTPPSPPPKPRSNMYAKKAPPLPPKATPSRLTVSFSEDEIDSSDPFSSDNVGTEGAKHLDWFSNPLFGQENIDHKNRKLVDQSNSERRDKNKSKKKSTFGHSKNSKNKGLVHNEEEPNIVLSAVDVPDFCRPQRNSVCGTELVLNSSDEQQPVAFEHVVSLEDTLRCNTNIRPLAASSPKAAHGGFVKHAPLSNVNPSNLNPRHRDSSSSSGGDAPPALPRKCNVHATTSLPEEPPKDNVQRKVSQYDNVFASPPPAMFLSPTPAVKSQSINQKDSFLKPSDATASLFPNFRPEFNTNLNQCHTLGSSHAFLTPPPFSGNTLTVQQHCPLRAYSSEPPPPLPPKKRNIMSYMEMFGQSVLPTGIFFL